MAISFFFSLRYFDGRKLIFCRLVSGMEQPSPYFVCYCISEGSGYFILVGDCKNNLFFSRTSGLIKRSEKKIYSFSKILYINL